MPLDLAAVNTRFQASLLRTLLGLPPRVQRVLAGRPVMRDGQTLDVETQLVLRLQKVTREPAVESVPIPGARAALLKQSGLVAGDQPIGEVREVKVDGADGLLPARLYVPHALLDSLGGDALLVFFHGGGWTMGDLDSHDAVCRVLAEEAGVRVLSVEYRLAPESPYPAGPEDCAAAYRWVVGHTTELGADTARLAVGGDSAGGNLAALTAIAAAREKLPLRFQFLLYPATDHSRTLESHRMFGEGFYLTHGFMNMCHNAYLGDHDPRDPGASPLFAKVPKGLAPAYVCTAGFDPLRDEGEAYARKLADAGVTVELKRFPGLIHSFLNVVGVGRSSRAAVDEAASRLRAGLAAGA